MAKSTIGLEGSTKKKRDQLAKANGTNKRAKKTWTSSFYLIFDLVLIADKKFYQSYNFLFCSLIFWFYPSFGFFS